MRIFLFKMKKIFIFTFIFLITGCSGSPLENCTDSSIREHYTKALHVIKSDKEVKQIFSKELEYKETVFEYVELVLDKSLSDKMKNKTYRGLFQQCEDEKRNYPNSFEAQWE